jgi:hypothetical protein
MFYVFDWVQVSSTVSLSRCEKYLVQARSKA